MDGRHHNEITHRISTSFAVTFVKSQLAKLYMIFLIVFGVKGC
jgi:hypothetical protein